MVVVRRVNTLVLKIFMEIHYMQIHYANTDKMVVMKMMYHNCTHYTITAYHETIFYKPSKQYGPRTQKSDLFPLISFFLLNYIYEKHLLVVVNRLQQPVTQAMRIFAFDVLSLI